MAIQKTEELQKKCKPSKLHEGEYLSRVSYLKVLDIRTHSILVSNEKGTSWTIDTNIVAEECFSVDQFSETKEMTRTELVAEFNKIDNAAFTVNFNKQPKVEDAFEAIANKGTIKSNSEMKKALKEQMKGEERTLIGYVVSRDVALGRTMVRDLEQPDGDAIRLVDHRTLNWFICQNVKYVVKSK